MFALAAKNPYDWKMSCERFLEAKQRILLDDNLDRPAKDYLIRYLGSKLDQPCTNVLTSVP